MTLTLRFMMSVLALGTLFCAATLAQATDRPRLAALDANGDGSVDFAELQGRRPDATLEQFQALDLDGNGLLSREEIVAGIRAGKSGALPMPPAIDQDGNGSLSLEELRAVRPGLTEERFSALDSDRDGELSREELRQGRPQWKAEVFKVLDADGDGKLSSEELQDARMKARPFREPVGDQQ